MARDLPSHASRCAVNTQDKTSFPRATCFSAWHIGGRARARTLRTSKDEHEKWCACTHTQRVPVCCSRSVELAPCSLSYKSSHCCTGPRTCLQRMVFTKSTPNLRCGDARRMGCLKPPQVRCVPPHPHTNTYANTLIRACSHMQTHLHTRACIHTCMRAYAHTPPQNLLLHFIMQSEWRVTLFVTERPSVCRASALSTGGATSKSA